MKTLCQLASVGADVLVYEKEKMPLATVLHLMTDSLAPQSRVYSPCVKGEKFLQEHD